MFDPLGFISTTITVCKIILQQLWQARLGWDEGLPTELLQQWQCMYNKLPLVEHIHIDRLMIGQESLSDVQLHGYSDAFEKAYGACIYIRSTNEEGRTTVKLLCSKSRVAPVKRFSLPRLELCGALLLSRLFNKVFTTISLSISKAIWWTDSTIMLTWIAAIPTRWKTFIANRVTELQENNSAATWMHVPSGDNPSNLILRGLIPEMYSSAINYGGMGHPGFKKLR
jgi:hypothetical protein